MQEWNASLELSSKGKNYKLLKDNLNFENYLIILPKDKYLPILKVRTSNTYFLIETARWSTNYIPYQDRKCPLCNKNDLADEFHYGMVCDYFKNKRALYLSPYYTRHPNVLKYKELFSSNSVSTLNNLSTFVNFLLKYTK